MKNCVAIAALLILTAVSPLSAQTESPAAGLQLERELGPRSLEKIADGSAAQGQSKLQPRPAARYTYLPALILGGVVIALASFGAGLLSVRRRPRLSAPASAPVQLWADTDALAADLEQTREQLAGHQEQLRLLAEERDLAVQNQETQTTALRQERDAAVGEVQALRLHRDESELSSAQETIDELRGEVERLNELLIEQAQPTALPVGSAIADNSAAALQEQLDSRQNHILELESLLLAVHTERDALEQHVTAREAQLRALEETLDHRDEELEQTLGDLEAKAQQGSLLDQHQHDLARVQHELVVERERHADLQYQLAQANSLYGSQEQSLAAAHDRIAGLELDLSQSLSELAERERGSNDNAERVRVLQHALDEAELRIASLDSDLDAANTEMEMIHRAPEATSLQQENLQLSKLLAEREHEVAELQALSQHGGKLQDWTSTVSSLENELRRKSAIIDEKSDSLAQDESRFTELQAEMNGVKDRLAESGREIDSLQQLLSEARTLVVKLRDQLSARDDEDTRVRLTDDPKLDPFGNHADAIDPWDADIETLQFAVRSRSELADSLESILGEERMSLDSVEERESDRVRMRLELENEIAANRVKMVAMQSRIHQARESRPAQRTPSGPLERELQQNLVLIESLRLDLQKWQKRIKPLHKAVLLRDSRLRHLEAELDALRKARINRKKVIDAKSTVVEEVTEILANENGDVADDEQRQHLLKELEQQWRRIVDLESELEAAGLQLGRAMEVDDVRDQEIESLESARAGQRSRVKELQEEMATLGLRHDDQSAGAGNVVDLGTRRP